MTKAQQVKALYEQLPYPPRDPEEEKFQLIRTAGDTLAEINHYCFNGKQTFTEHFSCLVAGGGTGDSAIYLAEQLKTSNAKIYYLDMSSASMEVAKARAKVRELTNIHWVQESIENIPELDLPQFDFINCSGVLHHLPNPELGLACLASKLKSQGAIFLMLYAKYGRRAIYETQQLLRSVHQQEQISEKLIKQSRKLLYELPESNSFKKEFSVWEKEINVDAGLADLLLHPQDRAYSVSELIEFAASANLNFVNFTGPQKRCYDPLTIFKDNATIEKIRSQSQLNQFAIAELAHGGITKHQFYLSPSNNTEASIDDLQQKLLLSGELANQHMALHTAITPGIPLNINYNLGEKTYIFSLPGTTVLKEAVRYFDGNTSIEDIIGLVKSKIRGVTEAKIHREIKEAFTLLNSMSWAYLMAC